MGRAFDSLGRNGARRTALVAGPLTAGALLLWGTENQAAPAKAEAASTPVVVASIAEKDRAPAQAELLPLPNASARTWQIVSEKFWQIAGPAGEDPNVTDAREGNRGAC